MSKNKNGPLDQCGAGPFEQQQFGTAGIEGVNYSVTNKILLQSNSICLFCRGFSAKLLMSIELQCGDVKSFQQ